MWEMVGNPQDDKTPNTKKNRNIFFWNYIWMLNDTIWKSSSKYNLKILDFSKQTKNNFEITKQLKIINYNLYENNKKKI